MGSKRKTMESHTRYRCSEVDEDCVADPQGQWTTYEDCWSSCKTPPPKLARTDITPARRFECANNQCVESLQGSYALKSDCELGCAESKERVVAVQFFVNRETGDWIAASNDTNTMIFGDGAGQRPTVRQMFFAKSPAEFARYILSLEMSSSQWLPRRFEYQTRARKWNREPAIEEYALLELLPLLVETFPEMFSPDPGVWQTYRNQHLPRHRCRDSGDCIEADPRNCKPLAVLQDAFIYASEPFQKLSQQAVNAQLMSEQHRAEYEKRAEPFVRCSPWIGLRAPWSAPADWLTREQVEQAGFQQRFDSNPDVVRLRESLERHERERARPMEQEEGEKKQEIELKTMAIGGTPSRDLLVRLIEQPWFIGRMLASEFSLLTWKREQYQRKIANIERNATALARRIERYKSRRLTPDSYKKEQETLDMSNIRIIAFQDLLEQIDARLTVLNADLQQSKRLMPGRAVSSVLILEKQQRLRDVISLVDTLEGKERQPLRQMIYNRIMMFAQSESPFIGSFVNNVSLSGRAGVGKSTAADIIARSLFNIGLLLTPNVYSRKESDLVAQYVGQTAPLMRSALEQSLEGVMFIDEAYSLSGCPPNYKTYGKEAIDTLVDFLSEHAGLLSVIVAGYPEQMVRCFFAANEGLPRRFATKIALPSYSPDDLYLILDRQLALRMQPPLERKASAIRLMFGESGAQLLRGDIKSKADLFSNQAGDMQNLADFLLEQYWLSLPPGATGMLELPQAVASSAIRASMSRFEEDKLYLAKEGGRAFTPPAAAL